MCMSEAEHPWITSSGQSILKQPFFELTNFPKWNNEMGKFYKRVNETKDERSFVILMALVVEFHIDAVFRAFFPNSKELLKDISFTFSLKIIILKSLRLIPDRVFQYADLIRKIRNEFAHKIEIDRIHELNSYDKGRKLVVRLDNLCKQYSNHLTYSKNDQENYREKYKDIADFANNALREYEPSVLLLRKELEKKIFIEEIIVENNFKML